jgi:serine/threonine protein kinase
MITCLCVAADILHNQHIIIGDLDPSTVILNGATVDDQVGLMISWLPPGTHKALSPESPASLLSYFIAPEALQGEADARSDIYSLGAIFYLLLTGMPPEESSLRHRSRLRAPYEINPRMSLHISESVMQALALDPNERFQTIAAFTEALHDPRYRRPEVQPDAQDELSPEVETVRILPLSYKDLARWRSGRAKKQEAVPIPVSSAASATQSQAAAPEESSPAPEAFPEEDADVATLRVDRSHLPRFDAAPVTGNDMPAAPASGNGHRVPESVPATPANELAEEDWSEQVPQTPPPAPSSAPSRSTGIWPAISPRSLKKSLDIHSWIEQIKRVVLGQQQHAVAAAAIIETPLRVLPDQLYTIRLHIMGRNREEASTKKQQSSGGLSALVHGDTAIIEVRSVLQESYAYVVQMARVTIPAEGYVAEVSIPMQPLSNSPTGRRDRLHVFFLNENRHPLYEKPFVLEIFVSHHVKRGSEGHHVLTIPV